ncbi:MAG: hypothetical protein COB78_02395 [Hyphomicrobiales bacterium]|nr:MAG: hypothetical protein COB78_02395 [Hyphomicrobiales bacterium]
MRIFLFLVAVSLSFTIGEARAENFKYYTKVTLVVGDSIILKGVRGRKCGKKAPGWGWIWKKLPKSKTGSFSNGGKGTVLSNSCGGTVGARGVKFTAKKAGRERLKIYGDTVHIIVK